MAKSDTLSDDELICIATLKKPYGIKGWLWVFSHMQNHSDIFALSPWYLRTATGFKPLTVQQWRVQGSGLVASFEQVPDRNTAETMQGATIWAPKACLPALADDEYYWSDLIGLRVVNEEGEYLGVVKNLFETAAHDMMTVVPKPDSIDNQERLIPWHNKTVVEVQLAQKQIVVAWGKDY